MSSLHHTERSSRQTTMLLRFDAMKTLMVEVENLLIRGYSDSALTAIRVYRETYGPLDAKMFDIHREKIGV